MDYLQQKYNPQSSQLVKNYTPLRVDSTNMYFNPAVANRWAGNFPLDDPMKKVVLELEPVPNTIFQHPSSFSYYPEHSNLDVNLL